MPGPTRGVRWSQALDADVRGLDADADADVHGLDADEADTGAGRESPGPRAPAAVRHLVPTPPHPPSH